MAKKILIIEDHIDAREMLALILRHKGYEPLEAMNGNEGLAMTLAHHPDLILMDLGLPGMDGFETARKIKENLQTSQIPIVACSAWGRREMAARARQAGMEEYIVKPVTFVAIVEVIERLTQKTRATDPNKSPSASESAVQA